MEEEIIIVRDIMVPLEEYATVSQDVTLYEAVLALEKAQENVMNKQYLYFHRAILVYDENKKIVGKISHLDVLKALEPKYSEMGDMKRISAAGFSQQFLKSMMERYSLCDKSFTDMCRRASKMIVKDFMYTPTQGEYVREDTSLDEAIHQLILGNHQSLLVTKGKDIVGVLRLTDVFREICQAIKACQLC